MKATLTTRRGRLRTLLFFAIGLSAGALATLAYGLHLFPRLELTTVDTRFSIRGDAARPSDVVVVGIDDVTFERDRACAGRSRAPCRPRSSTGWPRPARRSLPRTFSTRSRRRRCRGAARSASSSPKTRMPRSPTSVYDAGQRGSKVVLSTTEVAADGSTNVLGGNLRVLGARAGNGNYIPDADGVIRRFPYQIDRARDVSGRGRRARARAHARPVGVPREGGLDRLRRPAGGGSVSLLLAGADGEVRPRGRAREDGGRRRHGARRCRTSTRPRLPARA